MEYRCKKEVSEVVDVERKLCLACNRQFQEPKISHCPHDSTQLVNLGKSEDEAWVAKVIDGKYKMLEIIGKGGSGTCYRAEQLGIGRMVAVQLRSPISADNRQELAEFERRIAELAAVTHPSLCTLYDFGVIERTQPYVVMEFIQGESLSHIVRTEGCLDPVRFVSIFDPVSKGLEAAHQKGLVHGDLRPSNIIVTNNGVKIVDFAPHKVQFSSDTVGLEAFLSASVRYMSPEQCAGKPPTVLSDIYCLGILMYEALTGKPPFDGRHPLETGLLHISSQRATFTGPPSVCRVTRKLQELVVKALEKDGINRFSSMAELGAAIANCSATELK